MRAAIFLVAAVGLALGFWPGLTAQLIASVGGGVSANLRAFLAMIRQVESNGDYSVIAGGDHFSDFSEHPFVLDPGRVKPLGTTAAGAYQMVRQTWAYARDALSLPDFSPSSQDKAAAWLVQYKVPGQNRIEPAGTGNLALVEAGDFEGAMRAFAPEWESLGKIIAGRYPFTLAQAEAIYNDAGGSIG